MQSWLVMYQLLSWGDINKKMPEAKQLAAYAHALTFPYPTFEERLSASKNSVQLIVNMGKLAVKRGKCPDLASWLREENLPKWKKNSSGYKDYRNNG